MVGTIEEQIKIEESIKEQAIQEYINDLYGNINNNTFSSTTEGNFLIKATLKVYVKALKDFLKEESRGPLEKEKKLLRLFSASEDVIGLVVINCLINFLGSGVSPTIVNIASKITNELSKVSLSDNIIKDNPKFISYLGREFKQANKRRKEQIIERHVKDLKDFDSYNKDKKIATKIGVLLLDVLINSGANLIEKTTEFRKGHKVYILKLTEDAREGILQIGKNSLSNIMNIANRLPTIVPPVDYTVDNNYKGGYYKYPISLVKASHAKHKEFLKGKDLSKVLPIVNKMQQVPWKFNTAIVDIITDIFENNLIDPRNLGLVPKLFGDLPVSDKLDIKEMVRKEMFGEFKENGWELEKENHHEYIKTKNETMMMIDKEIGKRFSLVFALATYTKMCDYDCFYFPQQLDYRGRIYPHPNFVSIQQPAYIKAMLQFANGEYLTADGEIGLKIHIANCYGLDKKEYWERLEWFDNNINNIISYANDPEDTIYDWTLADSPFEFLAGCLAYKDHKEGLKVYLPIALDATCSGIQIYSGMLRDLEGAKAVNVVGDTREDIYNYVAKEVENLLEKEDYPKEFLFTTSDGEHKSINTEIEAKSLIGNITRSLVKRNVMTVPYSVTFRGMQDQLKSELDDLKFSNKSFWKGELWVVVRLLATLNYNAINNIVKAAQLGQNYLKDISKLLKETASWNTPIYNFPVYQPSYKVDTYRVYTLMGVLSVQYKTDKLDTRGQVNAIAPNVIHSIDATILYGAVERFPYDIGTVHDCFMVPANYWVEIQEAFKDSFIATMECNPLEYIGKQIDPEGIVEVPMIGTLDLEDIRNSLYIIS